MCLTHFPILFVIVICCNISDWQPFDHKPTKCGSDSLSGIAGFIQSPNYPGIYPQNVNCSWVIKVAEKQQILLRVLELDIGQDCKCCFFLIVSTAPFLNS